MKSLKVNALANIMLKFMNIAFPLITGPYIARVLNKGDYGNFNIVNTLISLFIPFATLGVYNYGIREISRVRDSKKEINITFSKLFYISAFGVLVTTAVYYIYVILIYGNSNLKLLCYIMGAQIFCQIFNIEWMNEAFENYTFILYKTFLIRILIFAGIFIFVKKESDIIPYAVIMTVMNSLNFVLSYVWIKKDVRFVKVRFSEIKPIIKPLISILLLANANMLYTILDRTFLSYVSEPVYVTYYTISQNIIYIVAGVILGAITVNVPRMNYYLGIDDEKSYIDLLKFTSKMYMFFIIPLSFGMAILSSYVILLYGGNKYIGAGLITGIFAIRTITWAIDVILGNLIIFVKGYEKNLTINYFIGGFINIVLNGMLVKVGIIKPEYYLLTTFIAEILVIFLHINIIIKKDLVNIRFLGKDILRYTGITLVFIPIYIAYNIILPIELLINLNNFLRVLGFVIICILYYFIINTILKDDIIIYAKRLFVNIVGKLCKIVKK